MSRGKNLTDVNDWISNFDPRVTGLADRKGSIFRYIPAIGAARLLLKQDSGFSTNWTSIGVDDQPFVYYVTPGIGDLPTIQSAIDLAFAEGSGTNGIIASIYVPPGAYTENLIFRPGQSIIAQGTQVAAGAITIVGQHVYAPPVNSDPLSVILGLQGITFLDELNGPTISFLGPNGALFSINGCAFGKGGTGNPIFGSNPNAIFVINGSSTINHSGADAFISSDCLVTVIQQCSFSSGAAAPMLDHTGAGFTQFSNNTAQSNSPYIASFGNGFIQASYNSLQTSAPDSDCLRIAAGVTLNITHSTLVCPAGLGYVLQGLGTANVATNVYPDNNVKDPALTLNLLNTALV